MTNLKNIIFLALNFTFVLPFSCIAEAIARYFKRAKEILSLLKFLTGNRNKKGGVREEAVGLINFAIDHKFEKMEFRKIDFRLGKIKVEMTKLMLVDFEGKITIPKRFAATNETLFENFHPFLRGCEKYEVLYFKNNIIEDVMRFTVEEMDPILFAFKCCFRQGKSYKINLHNAGITEVALNAKTINNGNLGDSFNIHFEYS